jgi:hypothetical protein
LHILGDEEEILCDVCGERLIIDDPDSRQISIDDRRISFNE